MEHLTNDRSTGKKTSRTQVCLNRVQIENRFESNWPKWIHCIALIWWWTVVNDDDLAFKLKLLSTTKKKNHFIKMKKKLTTINPWKENIAFELVTVLWLNCPVSTSIEIISLFFFCHFDEKVQLWIDLFANFFLQKPNVKYYTYMHISIRSSINRYKAHINHHIVRWFHIVDILWWSDKSNFDSGKRFCLFCFSLGQRVYVCVNSIFELSPHAS